MDHPCCIPLPLRRFQFVGICSVNLIIPDQFLGYLRTAFILFHLHIDLCLFDQHTDILRCSGLGFFRFRNGFGEFFRLYIAISPIALHPDHM